ncbi:MAG: site-2 protease family protein, partial [Eubacteriales bacterium]|nr:site-2 protease family protein [Eubacteriales bacterium]
MIFGFMIFIHELGHFLTARACGVGINEFAIGMGPKLFTHISKKSGIRYSLRLLPIGGFVSMVGEDEESEAENAFGKASALKRLAIIVAGAFMNLLLGMIIMFVMVVSTGGLLATNVVGEFSEGAVSNQQLMVNDKIIKVGNSRVYTGYDCYYEIMNQGYKAIDLTVIRGG